MITVPMVEIENLSFAYEKHNILESINLSIKTHDFLAIIGPNGGGKSTLLKLILGIHTYQHGSIKILGRVSEQQPNDIGYVPQNTNINTHFPIKVIEVVMMGHASKKRPLFGYSKEEEATAMEVLSQVGMANYAQTKIGILSGGQRQRVMIARALFTHPSILILDEPTSSIDVAGQREVYDLLKQLNDDITIVVVSHDISIILEYANKVAHINKNLSFHDISDKQLTFHTHGTEDHFCEIELLQMLGSTNCNTCEDETHNKSASSC